MATYDIAIVAGLGIVSYVFAFIGLNIDPKKHGMMQFFFLTLSMTFSSVLVWIMYKIALIDITDAGLSTNLSNVLVYVFAATLISTAFFMMYSLITWLYNMIMSIKEKKES